MRSNKRLCFEFYHMSDMFSFLFFEVASQTTIRKAIKQGVANLSKKNSTASRHHIQYLKSIHKTALGKFDPPIAGMTSNHLDNLLDQGFEIALDLNRSPILMDDPSAAIAWMSSPRGTIDRFVIWAEMPNGQSLVNLDFEYPSSDFINHVTNVIDGFRFSEKAELPLGALEAFPIISEEMWEYVQSFGKLYYVCFVKTDS